MAIINHILRNRFDRSLELSRESTKKNALMIQARDGSECVIFSTRVTILLEGLAALYPELQIQYAKGNKRV